MDEFKELHVGLESPATTAHVVTPNDGADLAHVSRALNVASEGFVHVTTLSGSDAVIYVGAGMPFPIRATRVWQSGTTASGIVSLS